MQGRIISIHAVLKLASNRRLECRDVLAVVATERDLVGSLRGLVNRLGLLRVEGKALLAVERDTNSLVVHETGML